MRKIFVHKFSGVLSAVGIGLADVVQEAQEPSSLELDVANMDHLNMRLDLLESDCRSKLKQRGFRDEEIKVQRFMNLRYDGTDVPIMTGDSPGTSYEEEFLT